MIVVDANVLLHSVNSDAPQHEVARTWLDGQLGGGEPIAFPWVVILAFLRLGTRAGVFPRPLTIESAFDAIDAWIDEGGAIVVEPSARHRSLLRGLLTAAGTGGNLTIDAHVAAIALELGATLATFDRDYQRFDGLKVQLLR